MILAWYRQNSAEFGRLVATSLLLRVIWRRSFVNSCNALLPARVECPCCGWSGNRFLDYIEAGYSIRNIECPQCGSHSRHRALFLWLRNDFQIAQKSGAALIFAPERALATLWSSAPNLRKFKIDIEPVRDVEMLADVMSLPFADEVADLIWCHHVLEQVPDDRRAMRELRRVLKKQTGQLILSAGPVAKSLTREFANAGQHFSGNRRSYGMDLPRRLGEAGLEVTQLYCEISEQDSRRYGILKEPFFLCRKV
ncbi:MAG TPA: class I SAM-dependent methyltransferase [Pyrinomonadaceae bacterium]|jgi:SAM-dependent methyltransferase|nr:class I SAM-dependent methyltransferase [Pyrinomonadaceae bacterium]